MKNKLVPKCLGSQLDTKICSPSAISLERKKSAAIKNAMQKGKIRINFGFMKNVEILR